MPCSGYTAALEQGFGCAGSNLHVDEACFDIHVNAGTGDVSVWYQSEQCYQCDYWYWQTITDATSSQLVTNTTHTTNFIFSFLKRNESSSLSYHFGEFGNYSVNIDGETKPEVEVLCPPSNVYIPLLYAVTIILFIVAVANSVYFIYKKRRNVIDRDLGPVHESDNIPIIRPERRQIREQRLRRIRSIDVFRGLAIVLMIFVNYGGGKYWFFRHSSWNGLTVADLVFPWFLWIMGISLTLSIRSQLRQVLPRKVIFRKIFIRSVELFALGLILNSGNGRNDLTTLRIPGVLQRFSICYFVVASLELCFMRLDDPYAAIPNNQHPWHACLRDIWLPWKQWLCVSLLVTTHLLVTFLLPVPGCPKGYLGPGGLSGDPSTFNCTGGAAGWIDRAVFGSNHIYQHPTSARIFGSSVPYDPEGLLGILTSIFLVELGVQACRILLMYQNSAQRVLRWMIWAFTTGLLAGVLCLFSKEHGYIPINKNLWSFSYVCCTGSMALILFTLMYLIIDYKSWWSGTPLHYPGMNAILMYLGHEVFHHYFPWSWQPVPQTHFAHLFMNMWGTCLWIMISYALFCKKLFFSL